MKGMLRFVGALVLSLGLSACEPIEDGGGGGGGGSVLFTRGFAFVREADRNVYLVDDQGDANSPQRLTAGGGVSHPSVSRNGRSVVYVQQTSTGGFEVRTALTDGSANPSTVFASGNTQCPGCTNFRFPSFNPSNNVIVFAYNRGTGTNFGLARVNADGSGFQELTAGSTLSFGAPSFFPDGQSVLAPAGSSSFDLRQLARVSLSGGSPTFITNTLGGEAQVVVTRAVVSPDGRQVALDGRVSSGGTRIFVGSLTPSFGPLRMVTDHPGEAGAQDTFPSWVNATQVGFLSNAGGSQNIYRVSLTGTVGPGSLVVPSAAEPSYGGT